MKPRYKERVALKSPVIFTNGSQIGQGRVLDLTIPGCLIESPVRVQKGQSLELKMFLPNLKTPITTALAVVRWTNGTQFGVEFIKMDESQRKVLNGVVAHHLSELASGRESKNTFGWAGELNWHLETYSVTKPSYK